MYVYRTLIYVYFSCLKWWTNSYIIFQCCLLFCWLCAAITRWPPALRQNASSQQTTSLSTTTAPTSSSAPARPRSSSTLATWTSWSRRWARRPETSGTWRSAWDTVRLWSWSWTLQKLHTNNLISRSTTHHLLSLIKLGILILQQKMLHEKRLTLKLKKKLPNKSDISELLL